MHERTSSQNSASVRLHYIDFSRAVLFSLGIVLHAAWLCQYRGAGFRGIHDFIHDFRMPGFFLIAGFFCAGMLAKYSPEVFLLKRLRRLGIPLLFFVVIDAIVNCPNHSNWTDYSQELTRSYWISGRWLEHLWFLGTLIAYVVLLFCVHKVWPGISLRVRKINVSLFGFFLLTAIVSFVALHVERFFPRAPWAKVWFFVDQIKGFEYFAFFAGGYILFHHQDLLEALSSRVVFNVANVVLFWLTAPHLVAGLSLGKYLVQLWLPVYSLSICGILFWVARRFVNPNNATVRSLADASYTVYLVHWPIIVALERLINTPQTPALLIFSVLVFCTAILSYACHVFLVKKSHVLAFLMNGQPLPNAPTQLDELPSGPKPAVAVVTHSH